MGKGGQWVVGVRGGGSLFQSVTLCKFRLFQKYPVMLGQQLLSASGDDRGGVIEPPVSCVCLSKPYEDWNSDGEVDQGICADKHNIRRSSSEPFRQL